MLVGLVFSPIGKLMFRCFKTKMESTREALLVSVVCLILWSHRVTSSTNSEMPGVVSVFPNKRRKLHTTHSWEFLGMPNDNSLEVPTDSSKHQEHVIIGLIDTGIWPESPSFSDHLMSPVPPRWKGECQSGEEFPTSTCNRKLIGARYYLNGLEAEKGELLNTINSEGGMEYRSARDSLGHGSHTASTAAGRLPEAVISPTETVLGSRPAPQVASFSSKGPNTLTPDILKPDLTAPGLNILAAWTPVKKGMQFNIISGTSMACPHVTGIAALIKAAHPSWTPSAIKSAIMTTANVLDKDNKIIKIYMIKFRCKKAPEGRIANPFDFGAGLISPMKVGSPGLVYDAEPTDYMNFLCGTGYDDGSLRLVTGDHSVCPKSPPSASNLNYPSITVSQLKGNRSIVRTVTNVGNPKSIYRARISSPRGITVQVVPNVLVFNSYGQKISFTVELKANARIEGYVFGSLSWVDGNRRVRSPLVVSAVSS